MVWELIAASGAVNTRYLPAAHTVLATLAEQAATGTFWGAVWHTIVTWAIGLAIAVVGGVVVGVVLGTVPALRTFTASTIEFLRPVPSVALIPAAVLILGTGMASTLLLVVYASFWQVLVQVLAGVQDVDPVADDTARSYRFRTLTRIRTVIWPTTLPYAITGVRLAAAVALILTVTGELLISTDGLGGLLSTAREGGAYASMYAFVLVAGLLGVIVNLGARALERRTLFWHPSVRMEVAA
jgi:ABC-type nitrate/sulfonate/bicarbonate transport system permease component